MSQTTDAATVSPAPSGTVSPPEPRRVDRTKSRADRIYRGTMLAVAASAFVVLFLIGLFLLLKGLGVTHYESLWTFITSTAFNPQGAHPVVGVVSLLYWTVIIALIACVIGVPIAVATALFITEYAPRRLRRILTSVIDLLAVVPSVIFGVWGFYMMEPNVKGFAKFLAEHFGWIPIFHVSNLQSASATTASAFIAGIVVGIMIVPIITSILREIFSLAPIGEREGALALGSTRAGVIRAVVLPFGRGGLIGGIMLGLGRALGETIAIGIIVSLTLQISPQLLGIGANSIAAFIAVRFNTGGNNGLVGLLLAGFVLFVVTMIVNFGASIIVNRSRTGASA